jgi:Maltokinase N-terminal cap domain
MVAPGASRLRYPAVALASPVLISASTMCGMALVHRATLDPTKLELVATWLPGRAWHTGQTGELTRVAAYRFDDPAGAVGIETMLVRTGDGPVFQVPLTYREAPLSGADAWLLGTAEHSVLGRRWVYDGTRDPVYATVLASAILGNTRQAEELVDVDGRLEAREPSMRVVAGEAGEVPEVGTVDRVVEDDPTVIVTTYAVELKVARRPGAVALADPVLTGTWPGQETPVPLASAMLIRS